MKSAAEELNEMPQVGRDTLVANAYFETKVSKLPPEVNLDDLYTAWVNVIKRAKKYAESPELVQSIIGEGCEKARKIARDTMRDVREVMGISF